ncbi:hypothetical protein QBC47DRAFT_433894 [Echria macrotheca]|uniref:Uncharacterized protein n=1 Tax=Echria macrotheca TaxID=438768 RepID=A0AAJ0F856_9PEZI|nr:hypothetical protein QBC47DRAFT_433894 [Echria macrotheca]
MGYSIVGVERTADGPFNHSLTEIDSGGVAGGNEMLVHLISNIIGQKLSGPVLVDGVTQHIDDSIEESLRSALTKRFRAKLVDDVLSGPFPLRLQDDGSRTVSVSLTKDELTTCWEAAMRRTFELAQQQLVRLRQVGGHIHGIVVTGGSAQAPSAMAEIENICPIDLRCKIRYAKDMNIPWRLHVVALGAALTATVTSSVERFFNQGAAIGLQGGQICHDDIIWEEVARFVVDKERWLSRSIEAESAVIRLICDPNFHRRGPLPQAANDWALSPNNSYNLYPPGDLPWILPRGSWTLTVKLDSESLTVRLERLSRDPTRSSSPASCSVYHKNAPLYYDTGSGNVLVDEDQLPDNEDYDQQSDDGSVERLDPDPEIIFTEVDNQDDSDWVPDREIESDGEELS